MVVDAGKSITGATVDALTPNPRDPDDFANSPDPFEQYGREVRNDRDTTRLDDPINKFTTSDKAKEIERNLGVEYN